jgi:nucleoside-diphosphate-sugar epimerase
LFIRDLLEHPDFHFHQVDITTRVYLDKFLSVQLDFIFHLACPASPPHYQRDPLKTIRTCTTGTFNTMELARIHQARVLFSSTSEIYGQPQVHPQPEEYRGNVSSLGIRACYDEGKRISETIISEYRRVFGVNTAIARIFNTYGPNMRADDGRVITNFINQALSGQPLTVYGDGSQTRCFCFITDMVAGLVALAHSEQPGPINLGHPEEHTIGEVAELIRQLTHSPSSVRFHPLPSDDPTHRCPVITKATDLLKWTPGIDLKTGLLAVITYFQTQQTHDGIH